MALENNPLVSVIAISYNHGKYMKEAVNSLLNQDYSPLEIIISDDHSTDDSFEIAQQIIREYRGPHQIILKQNAQNLGIGGNVSSALQLARGELLVSADCDDISEPYRISRLIKFWQSQPYKPSLITSDVWDTAPNGIDLGVKKCGDLDEIKSINEWLKKKPHFFGCTNMYTRDIVNKFGLLRPNCGATDQIIVLRAILLKGALSLHEPLVHYRQGGVTGNKPMNVTDKINRLLKEAPSTAADIKQHIDDAKKFGFRNVVREHFKDRLAEANLIPKLLNAESLKEQLIIFFQERKTPLFKKIRLLSYLRLRLLHRILYKLKRAKKRGNN
jgi:glycosyltransferase involved in cell wall biosynthesis